MTDTHSDRADFTFRVEGKSADVFNVLQIQGTEEVSRLFAFEITLVSEKDDIDLEEMIGLPARLTLRGRTGKRHVHGALQEFEHLGIGVKFSQYRALSRPLSPRSGIRRTRESFRT